MRIDLLNSSEELAEVPLTTATLHQLFELQASKSADAIAFRQSGAEISFSELNRRTNQLAHYLAHQYGGGELLVGILIERSIEMVVGILAALKAGGVYVPIDPAYPQQRLDLMFGDSRPAVTITRAGLESMAADRSSKLLCIDSDWEKICGFSEENPSRLAGSADLAYVMYTSGSTGRPKGVMGLHGATINRLSWMWGHFGFEPGEVCCQKTSLSFVDSVCEVFGGLLQGVTTVILTDEVVSDVRALIDQISEEYVTRVVLVPSLLKVVLESEAATRERTAQVKIWVSSGEELTVKLKNDFFERFPAARLLNLYGSTEVAGDVTWHEVKPQESAEQGVPIGRPLSNCRVYVLDPTLKQVPRGVVGEIYVGGENLARGYWNSPDETAKRFIPDPYSQAAGERIYRTGDRGRYVRRGEIQYKGRSDQQVKVSGVRIELGEVEAAIRRHQAVAQAIVDVHESLAPEEPVRLIAYVVLDQNLKCDAAELRRYTKERIPKYMVPAAFVILDELPLNSNGKVDRKALAQIEVKQLEAAQGHIAPRNITEEVVARIWSGVLKQEEIGVEQDFFELGGDSLLGMLVMVRIQSSFGVQLSLAQLFERRTVAGLSLLVEQELRRGAGVEIPALVRRSREGELPLSYGQERLWFIDRLVEDRAAYLVMSAVRLSGEIDESALERGINEIVRRHEILRTRFEEREGRGVQLVDQTVKLRMSVIDLEDIGESSRETEIERIGSDEGRTAFDLKRAPLMRAKLVKTAKREAVLIVVMHHIVTDGWSLGIFNEELGKLYRGYCRGEEVELEELEVQYADYAIWQREWLNEDVLEKQVGYWRKELGEAARVLELPADHVRPAIQTLRCGREVFVFEDKVTGRVKEMSRREGVTLYMALLAGLEVLLYRYSGQEDISIGSPVANRSRKELEGLIGFFVNMLVMRAEVSGEESFRILLKKVKETSLGAYAHQDVPFEKLVEALQPERSLSYSALVQVTLALQNAPREELELGSVKTAGVAMDSAVVEYDLSVLVGERRGRMGGVVLFNADLFESETIRRMVRHLERVLEQVAENVERKIGHIGLMSAEELHQVVVEWNQTQVEYSRNRPVHKLVEEQAEKREAAVALVDGNMQISYGELNRRANQLGHYLRRKGVRTEETVGIFMKRSAEMVIGMAGVLKAGAAYVPLDPEYPTERVAFMIEETGMRLVVTEATLKEAMPPGKVQTVTIDGERDEIEQESTNRLESRVTGENLAYVIYTSGSTGEPKGVEIRHQGLMNLCSWHNQVYDVSEEDRATLVASSGFDASVWELWPYLSRGSRVYVIGEETKQSPEDVLEFFDRDEITISFLPTPLAEAVLQQLGPKELKVKRVLTGGDRLRLRPQEGASYRLINNYGPTENTVVCTYGEVESDGGNGGEPDIGRPIANVQVYIMNERQVPAPPGVVGELFIGGEGLARGYVGQAGPTAEKFVPDGQGTLRGGRLYRTGDLVRYARDGRIEYVGRRDHQVKVRGYRIELGEIEATVLQIAGVTQTAVVAKDDGTRKQLVGYVVLEDGAEVESRQMREHLKAKLPEYMVPVEWVMLKELPLTAAGKVDRSRLSALTGANRETERAEYVEARSEEEREMVEVWKQVLGLDRVGVRHNYFDLGGDSIRSIQVVSRARERGLSFKVQDMFQYPTIEELVLNAERVKEEKKRVGKFSLIRAEDRKRVPAGVEDMYPLSGLQAGMVYYSELMSESSVYHDIISMEVSAAYEGNVMRQVVRGLIRRHEILRTSFDLTSYSEGMQLVHERVDEDLREEDLSALDQRTHEETIKRWIEEEKGRPIDFKKAPMIRIRVHVRNAERFQLSMSFHHAILDGWSFASMLTELFQEYWRIQRGEAGEIKEPAVKYREYIALEKEAMHDEECERYWSEKLEGSEIMRISRRADAKSNEKGRSKWKGQEIKGELFERVKELSKGLGIPVKSVVLAAHLKVQSVLSGHRDVVSGLATNGRPEERDGERALGLFLNSLPLRMKLEGGSWRQLITDVFNAEQELQTYRRYPLVELQRRMGGRELFETLFVFLNFHVMDGMRKAEGMAVVGYQDAIETNYAMVTSFQTDGEMRRLFLNIERRENEITEEQADQTIQFYIRALEAMTADVSGRYEYEALLSGSEKWQLIDAWNDTAVAYHREKCIHQLFEKQAAERPDAIAIVEDESGISYGQLNQRANQLAGYLRRSGDAPERLIGLCMLRSIETVAGMLAILKAGGGYVPLDPEYPKERLSYVIEDAGIETVVTEEKLIGKFDQEGVTLINPEGRRREISQEIPANPGNTASADGIAYVMYTSGSTGEPKGVEVLHRGVVRLVDAAKYVELDEGEVVLQASTFTFDASTFEVWAALLRGGRLVLMRERVPTVESLRRAIEEYGVTTMWLTATLLNSVVEQEVSALRGVRQLLAGGEALSVKHVAQAKEELTGTRLVNGYGPTECTTFTCAYDIRELTADATSIPIGAAISNTRVYVLDEKQEPAPAGVIGELYIGGDGVGRGYLGRAEETSERFLPDGYAKLPGQRMYRSGDLVRYISDRKLEYVGRRDHQVKVRGYRIELGEIEAAMLKHPGVKQAAAAVKEYGTEKRLIGYIVMEEGEEISVVELRRHLKEMLPDYMVPGDWVRLEQMPTTSGGKIDRRKLAEMRVERDESAAEEWVGARTATEELLTGIWSETLGLERIGITENFFDRGGHSLLATMAMSRAVRIFGVRMPLKWLFEAPTISSLAVLIDRAKSVGQALDAPPLRRMSRDSELKLSYAQERLWFINQLVGRSGAHIVPFGLRLNGKIDENALEKAINEIVRRHEVLRTRFEERRGTGVQVIEEEVRIRIRVVDLKEIRDRQREEELKRVAKTEGQAVFDLSNVPLMRATLLRLGNEEAVLIVVMHHIVTDGWSMGIFNDELGKLYRGYSQGEEVRLDELEVQYADYAAWQREWLKEDILERQLGYWRNELGNAARVLELPADHARPAIQSLRGERVPFVFEEQVSGKIKEMSRREGVTLYMALLAGLDVLLYRYSGQEDISIGSPVANRNSKELEGLIGFFVNMLVMRVEMSGDESFMRLLEKVREKTLGAYAHQDVPFEKVVEALQPERSLSHPPLAQVTLTLQNAPIERLELGGAKTTGIVVDTGVAEYDLSVIVGESRDRIFGVVSYNADLFDKETIRRITKHFESILEQVGTEAGLRIGRVRLLTAEEEQQIIVRWSGNGTEYGREKSIQQIFEREVRERGDSTAVEFQEMKISYYELNSRANQLGCYLRRIGVGAEALVGICIERSIDMVIGMLAILKAGAGYVPLDPTYPVERLWHIIEDAGIGVIVSREKESESLPGRTVRLVDVEKERREIAEESDKNLESWVRGDNLAYVMYTSGSTGQPKGVEVLHRGVVRLIEGADYAELGDREVVLQASSVTFDASTFEIWGALLKGGKLVLMDERVPTVENLRRVIENNGVTTMWLTATLANTVIEDDAAALAGLRQLLVGGEALSVKHMRRARRELPATRLINGYGPTEGTTFTCAYDIEGLDEGTTTIPIGNAISNTRVYVLSEMQEVVPVGVVGELYIGGDGLGRGYLKRAEETGQQFVPDGRSKENGARLYRTGDLVRYGADGTIEYIGRRDHQVKVRGYRIELGEIEKAVLAQGGVKQAAVLVKENATSKRLVGYTVMDEGVNRTASDIREYLKTKLPDYMVPMEWVKLDEMPLTSGGKADRRRLAELIGTNGDVERREHIAPRTDDEREMAEVWKQVLGLERVGIRDNYFEMGGDSIRSIQVLSRARERGLSFNIQDLFQYPTIEELVLKAQRVAEQAMSVDEFSLISEEDRKRVPDGIEDVYPLSRLQAGMVYHSELAPDTAVYHDIMSYQVGGEYESTRFRAVVEGLIARHEILRTSFDLTGYSEGMQLVYEHVEAPVEEENVSALETDQQEITIQKWIDDEKKRPIDLKRAPLMRIKVHVRSGNRFQLTMSFHHAILDGWSFATMLTEMFQDYWSSQEGESAALTAPEAKYREYIALEREALNDYQSEQYWRAKLDGRSDLKRWKRRGGEKVKRVTRSEWKEVQVGDDLYQRVKELAGSLEVPVKSVLLAAHMKVQSLLSGSQDVVSGVLTNGRPEKKGGDRILGLFLNSLPVRVKLAAGSWKDLVTEIFAAEQEMLAHRRYPLAELQKKIAGEDLFDTLFAFLNFHVLEGMAKTEGSGLTRYREEVATNYEIVAAFNTDSRMTRLQLNLECGDAALGPLGADRVTGYYVAVLNAMINNPLHVYRNDSLLSEVEKRQLVEEWNDTKREYEREKCIHELVERESARRPDAVAVSEGDLEISYRELNERANRLARYLRRLGTDSEAPVGICMERSTDLIIGMLGISKAGGAYVPLDPDYPAKRLSYIIEDSGINIVLTRDTLVGRFASIEVVLVSVDAVDQEIELESRTNLETRGGAENLAYVIYTSGTTGDPKGVEIPHRGVVRLVDGIEYAKLSSEEVVLQASAITFDASTFEIWGALAKGGRLVLIEERVPTVEGLKNVIAGCGVTTMWLTATLLNAIVEEDVTALYGLKQLLAGGEALSVKHITKVKEELPHIILINGYGPTEGTTFTCTYEIGKGEQESDSIPIGGAISNTNVYVLDDGQEIVPAGVIGELCIGGDGLGRGYLKRADQTAERFIPAQYSAEPGQRLYRTGDLVRRQPDGIIDFLGRADHQVKVRGYRIELGEIEAAVLSHSGVKQAAVLVSADGLGKRLVGYFVTDDGVEVSTGELRSYLREKLPEYMIPGEWVNLLAMPLTVGGKVDRVKLEELAAEIRGPETDEYVAARTDDELTISDIWKEVLGLERVGVTDSYFELGGDSIRSIRILSKAREQGLRFTIQDLFQYPTIEELVLKAERVKETRERVGPFALINEEDRRRLPGDIEDAYPLSRLQAGMLYHSDLESGSAVYHDIVSYDIRGRFDIDVFRAAIQGLVKRHEILRTSFDLSRYSEAIQLVHKEASMPVEEDDIAGHGAEKQDQIVKRWIEDESRSEIDWQKAPLLRVKIHKRGEDRFQLSVGFHHAILDGWSFTTMLTELLLDYWRMLTGDGKEVEPPATKYREYVALEREAARDGKCERFWKKKLQGSRPAALPRLSDEEESESDRRSRRRTVEIDKRVSERLNELARNLDVPLKSVLLAAHMKVQCVLTGRKDVTTGLLTDGRPEENDGERMLGLFLNALPLRMELKGGDWAGLIKDALEAEREILPYRRYPLAELQKGLGRRTLFETLFIFQNFHVTRKSSVAREIAVVGLQDVTETNYPLVVTFNVDPESSVLRLNLTCDDLILDAEQIEEIIAYYTRALSLIVDGPDARYEYEDLLFDQEEIEDPGVMPV